ncbi:uncharacterized protein OCT59_020815 [Rhizophagus irregularis]|uniref:uncharacterized protein n=1 Tax=Rhizophagus irregularis TaxID=588596 RepID=UPI001A034E75|nr:hypothetical protein OCT59_020815 [Rhizophagus irregularis]GBC26673.2 hypothetical protein GLOIN_2v1778528 [Rhizophagus irregularis DAOM 181602=DAOM 197198]
MASANSDEAEIWLQLAELRRNRAFTTNKTFEELAYLMVDLLIFRRFCSKDQDILTNSEISFENIARFAKVANELQWKGPVVLITDCTKLQPKIPISKIPSVMITALPIKGNATAKEISNHLLMIIEMIAHCNINLVSFGADGAITEMKA